MWSTAISGTSPLYALQAVFSIDNRAVRATPADVYGVVSLVFWSITLIVSIKYVMFILRADNDGEGGVMALAALVQRSLSDHTPRWAAAGLVLGVVGASLFYGDSVITPAISVLSAVEGLKVSSPGLAHLVVPLSVGILVALFLVQRFGTQRVGSLFGPVMVVWFVVIGVAGLHGIAQKPAILRGLSPSYAFAFIADRPDIAFIAIGAVVLAITGAEALYADMGHFGVAPIRFAWFGLVFPALTVNYLAQGALILRRPASRSNPFFLLFPHWAQIPMVVLATAATVIASQAVISGAFSVSRQALRLGYLPHLRIRQTSDQSGGPDLRTRSQLGVVCGSHRCCIFVSIVGWFGRCLRGGGHGDLSRHHQPVHRSCSLGVALADLASGHRRCRVRHS